MNEYVSMLTVSQFRAFRRAIAVLMRARMTRTQAVEILVNAAMLADRDRSREYADKRFGS